MHFAGVDQFDGIFEMYPTSIKKLYVVDGGLSFNSPFPLLLRPQRGVDLILSFDFSARPTDTSPPFKVRLRNDRNELLHHKTNKMTCAPSEDSDQPGHPPSDQSLPCALRGS